MDNLLVIADQDLPASIAMAHSLCSSAESAGYGMESMTTQFASEAVFPDGGGPMTAYTGLAGMVPVLGDGGTVLLVAEPLYWFDLSRAQRNRIDEFYHHIMPARAKNTARECVILMVAREKQEGALEWLSRVFAELCRDHSVINRGVFQISDLDFMCCRTEGGFDLAKPACNR
ncbi:MAG: hypothetical protein LUE17_09785 [Planctomycetaceae bacterium]|nr:hypothetical protein [Planctomycetaceae bacterium]